MDKQKLLYYPLLPTEEELGSERSDFVRRWLEEELYPQGLPPIMKLKRMPT